MPGVMEEKSGSPQGVMMIYNVVHDPIGGEAFSTAGNRQAWCIPGDACSLQKHRKFVVFRFTHVYAHKQVSTHVYTCVYIYIHV